MGLLVKPEDSFAYFEKAYQPGVQEAGVHLGECYENGRGCPQDMEKAFNLYTELKEKGDAILAPYLLGLCYKDGKGCPVDMQAAFANFKIAADNGHDAAQYFVGSFYLIGDDVGQSDFDALMNLRRAELQGNALAVYALGIYHSQKNDYAPAREYLTKAARQNVKDAAEKLAELNQRQIDEIKKTVIDYAKYPGEIAMAVGSRVISLLENFF